MKRVLVTGAGGLLGSSVVGALQQEGHEVTALYRGTSSPEPGAGASRSVFADLLEDSGLEALSSIDADTVVHCASVTPQRFLGEDADRCAAANAVMDERVVAFCRAGDRRLFYLSGTSLYGTGGQPWHEQSPLSPRGPYLHQKAAGENLCATGLGNYLILRVSSPYGPRQRKTTVLSTFIRRALRGEDLLYHGSGARTQDFISAEDVARAIALALGDESIRGVFNVAGGEPVSMKRLAELVLEAARSTGSRILPSGQPDPEEGYRAAISIEKAATILGWSPSISLPEGIRRWLSSVENDA